MVPVDVFSDFEALLTFAEREYNGSLFLSRGDERISFSQFGQNVRKLASRFRSNCVYALSIHDPLLFAQAFYACVLSGAVAFLSAPEESATALPGDISILNDMDIVSGSTLGSARSTQSESNDLCTIAFSSGTTAAGKGVMLSQKNLLMDTAYSIDRYRFWQGKRILHVLPYHHLFGLVSDLLAPLHMGTQVHFPSHPLRALRETLLCRPDAISIPPAYVDAVLSISEFARCDADSDEPWMKILCSGAALSKKKSYQLLRRGILPCTAYGLTECSPCVTITEDDDVRPGTVGREIGCVKLAFSDDNEILVSGDTVMLGYYRNPDETLRKIRNGWLHTGDLGYRDEHGHIVLTGRKDNLLILPNGMNCSPEGIEARLSTVDGVQECVLLQNPSSTDELLLVIVKNSDSHVDTASINRIMAEHGIERYKTLYREGALPKNLMGKVIRKHVL